MKRSAEYAIAATADEYQILKRVQRIGTADDGRRCRRRVVKLAGHFMPYAIRVEREEVIEDLKYSPAGTSRDQQRTQQNLRTRTGRRCNRAAPSKPSAPTTINSVANIFI